MLHALVVGLVFVAPFTVVGLVAAVARERRRRVPPPVAHMESGSGLSGREPRESIRAVIERHSDR